MSDREELHREVDHAISLFRSRPQLERFFSTAAGYAVFPSVGKGGLIAGGAYGKGEVFEIKSGRETRIGYCDLTQGTLGLQIGGQSFRQIIFFHFKDDLDRFTYNDFTFSANASAVAVEAGASTAVDYANGVAVFTMAIGGLMGEAALGGQQFRFIPEVTTTAR